MGKIIVLGVGESVQTMANTRRHTENIAPGERGICTEGHYCECLVCYKINIARVALESNDTQDVFLLDVPLFNLSLPYSCEIEWLKLNVLFLLVFHLKKKKTKLNWAGSSGEV